MPTLSELTTDFYADLAGVAGGQWSTDDVKRWIKQALQKFPLHRPVEVELTAVSANQKLFSLANDIQAVEYVTVGSNEDELQQGSPSSWDDNDWFYLFVNRYDDTVSNELHLSTGAAALVGSGTTLTLQTAQRHAWDLADDDAITVPSFQLRILKIDCILLAVQQRMTHHAQQLTVQDFAWLNEYNDFIAGMYKKELEMVQSASEVYTPYMTWG